MAPEVPAASALEPVSLDVEEFRSSTRRRVAVRHLDRVAVVLGSGQRVDVVNRDQVARQGAAVLRRRSGGGAVLAVPGISLWIDAWIPADDALFDDDVLRASGWVGDWWARALEALGAEGVGVHREPGQRGSLSDLVCFAGLGAGEVHAGGRKVVGVAQWRCRQGALFQCLAYQRWDSEAVLDVLCMPAESRSAAADQLRAAAAGVGELTAIVGPVDLEQAVLAHLPPGLWEVAHNPLNGVSKIS